MPPLDKCCIRFEHASNSTLFAIDNLINAPSDQRRTAHTIYHLLRSLSDFRLNRDSRS